MVLLDCVIKKRIIKYLIAARKASCEELAREIKVDYDRVYTVTKELEELKHVRTKNITTLNYPHALYAVIEPAGRAFYKWPGYVVDYWWNEVITAPKKFWWVGIIGGYILGNYWPAITRYNEGRESTQQQQQSLPSEHSPQNMTDSVRPDTTNKTLRP